MKKRIVLVASVAIVLGFAATMRTATAVASADEVRGLHGPVAEFVALPFFLILVAGAIALPLAAFRHRRVLGMRMLVVAICPLLLMIIYMVGATIVPALRAG